MASCADAKRPKLCRFPQAACTGQVEDLTEERAQILGRLIGLVA